MGKFDLSINLAKEVSAYVRTIGKKSILQTHSIGNANLSGLKYQSSIEGDNVVLSETYNFIKYLLKNSVPSKTKINIGGRSENFIQYKYSQMGSNPAFWAQNQRTGALFYVKYGSIYGDARHLESEVIASKLYNLAGIQTADLQLGKLEDGTSCILSNFVPGVKELDRIEVKEAFAADAWLANWDSVMQGNTLSYGGRCVKIDCGGALKYRALGKEKTNFGNKVEELISLIDGRNYQSTYYYSDISEKALINSFKKVVSITDDAIRKVVSDEQLAQTLINRRNYMSRILREIELNPYRGKNLVMYLRKCSEMVQKRG